MGGGNASLLRIVSSMSLDGHAVCLGVEWCWAGGQGQYSTALYRTRSGQHVLLERCCRPPPPPSLTTPGVVIVTQANPGLR